MKVRAIRKNIITFFLRGCVALGFFTFSNFTTPALAPVNRTTLEVVDVRIDTKKTTASYLHWQRTLLYHVQFDKDDLHSKTNHQQAFLTQWKLHKLNRALLKAQSDLIRFTPITFPEEPFIS